MSNTENQVHAPDAQKIEQTAHEVLVHDEARTAITNVLRQNGVQVNDRFNLSEEEKQRICHLLAISVKLLPHYLEAGKKVGYEFSVAQMNHFVWILLCKMDFKALIPQVDAPRKTALPPPPPVPLRKVIVEPELDADDAVVEEDEAMATQPPTDTTAVDPTPLPAPAPPPAPENPTRPTPEQLRVTAQVKAEPPEHNSGNQVKYVDERRPNVSWWTKRKLELTVVWGYIKFAALWVVYKITGFFDRIYRFGQRTALAGYGRVKAWRAKRVQKKAAATAQPKLVQPPPTPLDAAKTGVRSAPVATTALTTEPIAPTIAPPAPMSRGRKWAYGISATAVGILVVIALFYEPISHGLATARSRITGNGKAVSAAVSQRAGIIAQRLKEKQEKEALAKAEPTSEPAALAEAPAPVTNVVATPASTPVRITTVSTTVGRTIAAAKPTCTQLRDKCVADWQRDGIGLERGTLIEACNTLVKPGIECAGW